MHRSALLRTPTLWLLAFAMLVLGLGGALLSRRAALGADAAVVAAEQRRLTGIAVAAAGRLDAHQLGQAARAQPRAGSLEAWDQAPLAARVQRAWLTDLREGLSAEHHLAAAMVTDRAELGAPLVRLIETDPMPEWLAPATLDRASLGALRSGEPAVTDVIAGRRGPSILAAAPLRGARGAVVGVVTVEAPLAPARAEGSAWMAGHQVRVAALLLTVGLLLGLVGARVARGRRKLGAAARRLAQTDLEQPIGLDGDAEVGDLLVWMEVARVRALDRYQEHAAQRARWARTTEALHRSMDQSAFRRRERLAELGPSMSVAVRLAGGLALVGRLTDLTSDCFTVELDGDVVLLPGASARLLLGTPEDGERTDIAVAVQETRRRADRMEVRLTLREPRRGVVLPRQIAAVRHQRDTRRVYPPEARPMLARVRGVRHAVVGRVRDLSEGGVSLLVRSDQLPTRGHWDTALTVEL